jgi:hypothetical protein
MKWIDAFFQMQLLFIQRVSHFVFGKPPSDGWLASELSEIETLETMAGKTTFRGDALRLQVARRDLVTKILAPR